MKSYNVTWSIEIIAASAEEAALIALDHIMIGSARIFEVTENISNHTELIDLENKDDGS